MPRRAGRAAWRRRWAWAWRHAWPGPWSLLGLACAVPALLAGAQARRVAGVLEVSGGRLGRLADAGRLPFGVSAITLGHVVLGSSAAVRDALRAHEHAHVRQYERWGLFFVPAYLADSLWQGLRGGHAYRDNRFEREARHAEHAGRLGST